MASPFKFNAVAAPRFVLPVCVTSRACIDDTKNVNVPQNGQSRPSLDASRAPCETQRHGEVSNRG